MQTNVSRAVRALRLRRGWRQSDLAARAGVGRDLVHRLETGDLRGATVGSIVRVVEAMGATLTIQVRWRGAALDQLVDAAHARLVQATATRLQRIGWSVHLEVSFNHFGDRGRCDLVAWHPSSRCMLIVEVKTRIGDLQETLGRIDVKHRLGAEIGRELRGERPAWVAAALVLDEAGTNRRALREYRALFARFALRGRSAIAWLRQPAPGNGGLLWFESPDSDDSRTKRVRRPRATTLPDGSRERQRIGPRT